jgi:hypothetical protein
VAGIAGLLTLAAGAATFTFAEFTGIAKQFFWKDSISVLEFRTGPDRKLVSVIANNGDGKVFLSAARVYWRGAVDSMTMPIQRLISPGDVQLSNTFNKSTKIYGDYVATKTGFMPRYVREQADPYGPCVYIEFYLPRDPVISTVETSYRKRGLKLASGHAEGAILYYSARSSQLATTKFPVNEIFVLASNQDCYAPAKSSADQHKK